MSKDEEVRRSGSTYLATLPSNGTEYLEALIKLMRDKPLLAATELIRMVNEQMNEQKRD